MARLPKEQFTTLKAEYLHMRGLAETVGIKHHTPNTYIYNHTMQLYARWSENDNQYIICNYTKKSDKEMAKYLFRTEISVTKQRQKLNLKRKKIWEK